MKLNPSRPSGSLFTLVALAWGISSAPAQQQTAISTSDLGIWRASFSGQARTMMEAYRNIDFGLDPIDDDTWLHQRVQAMLTLENRHGLLLATELSWGDIWGKHSPVAPPDRDDGDFLQLYAQWRFSQDADDSFLVRAGRQTLYYGSGRLLSLREGANQRLAHDAFLLSWQRGDDVRVDAFIASPVETKPGLFDNSSHPDQVRFWSLYAVMPSPWDDETHLDLYYIGLDDQESEFARGERELRHTFGLRWWDKTGPWLSNTEAIFQCGEAGDRDIVAGAFSLGIGRAFSEAFLKPTITLHADAISGGKPTGTLHTFHPLFQANNYFNEGGFVSPSNLYNINPVLTLQPHPKLSLSLGVNFQWRFSADDAVYAPPLQPLGPPAPESSRYLGTAFNAAISWQILETSELSFGFTHHEAGPSLHAIGGRDVDYFQAAFRILF